MGGWDDEEGSDVRTAALIDEWGRPPSGSGRLSPKIACTLTGLKANVSVNQLQIVGRVGDGHVDMSSVNTHARPA